MSGWTLAGSSPGRGTSPLTKSGNARPSGDTTAQDVSSPGVPAALGDGWSPVKPGVWQRTIGTRVETYAEGEAGQKLALETFRSQLPAVTDAYLAEPSLANRDVLDNYLAAIAAAEGTARPGFREPSTKAAAPPVCQILECEITSLFADAQPGNCGAQATAVGSHVNFCDLECFLTASASITLGFDINTGPTFIFSVSGSAGIRIGPFTTPAVRACGFWGCVTIIPSITIGPVTVGISDRARCIARPAGPARHRRVAPV